MIDEHNHEFLFYPEIKTCLGPAWLDNEGRMTILEDKAQIFFTHGDAINWAIRNRQPAKLVSIRAIRMPYRLEYDEHGVIWQRMRYYRTKDAALAGWQKYTTGIPLHNDLSRTTWRIIHTQTENVLISGIPAELARQ